MLRQIHLFHKSVRPEPAHHFLFVQGATAVLNEQEEGIEGFGRQREDVSIPTGTIVRCVGLSVVGYAFVRSWPVPGAWILLQLTAAVATLMP